jgi:hypothetical protein
LCFPQGSSKRFPLAHRTFREPTDNEASHGERNGLPNVKPGTQCKEKVEL